MQTVIKKPRRTRHAKIVIRGFIHAQLVNGITGKIEGDSGWVENSATQFGLTSLAAFMGQQAGSSAVNYGALGTQTAAFNSSQTDIVGQTASFVSLSLSTTGTCTMQATCSFASSLLGTATANSCNVGAAGLYYTNSAGSMVCGQIFTTSAWNTNQNFNLTYQLKFATA